MGRKKIDILPITDKTLRSVSYHNMRARGLTDVDLFCEAQARTA